MRRIITTFLLGIYSTGFSQTKALDSLYLNLAFETSASNKVNTTFIIIDHLISKENFDLANKYIKAGEKLSDTINYDIGMAQFTYYKALLYAKKNDYLNAMDGYIKAKTLFNRLKDSLYIAKVNYSIGQLELKRGNYNKGLHYSLSAVHELERQDKNFELKSAYTSLGTTYYKINDYNKAITYNLKALNIQQTLNDKIGANASYLQLAELYSQVKNHKKAIEFYEKTLTTLEDEKEELKREILPKLGGEYLQFNDFDMAANYLLSSLKLTRKNNDENNLLVTLNNLGKLNLQQNYLKTAEKQLWEARGIAQKIQNSKELLKNYGLMKSLDSTKRKFAAAFVWQRRFFTLKDSLDKLKSISLHHIADDISQMDLDLNFDNYATNDNIPTSNLKSVNHRREMESEFKMFKILFFAVLGLLVITSIFLILEYLKRNKHKKYVQKLEETNQKTQLQNKAFLEQTKQLENINNVKDKLFSIVSHDLKDSLSSINGFIELLKDGSLSKKEFDDLIPELSENANNASLLLYNLLNWSKSQMQSLKPSPSLFDIQEVFEEKIKLIDQRLENKGIKLINHSLKDFAYADRSMMEIVIQNLLTNALKFSKKNDTITVSNHINNGKCIISIADTGVGIPQKHIEQLFETSNYTTIGTNNEKGTGLGLSICKELVELNGGKIWVESTINVGSTFYIQLPKTTQK